MDALRSSVLVLGAGQVGTFAAQALAQAGARVVAADVDPAPGFFSRYAPAVGREPLMLDMLDEVAVGQALRAHEIDVVILSAGLVGDACARDPMRAWEINVEGTAAVTRASISAGVRRIVFVSTLAVYGRPSVARISEACSTAPASEYGKTKLAAELTIQRLLRGDVELNILRPCGVYGPLRTGRGSQSARFMQGVVLSATRSRRIAITATSSDSVQYLYVKDLARAIAASTSSTANAGSAVFNVVPPKATTARELIAAIKAVYPGIEVTRVEPDATQTGDHMPPLDGSLIARSLGFTPRYDLPVGLLDYVRAAGFSP
jgi:UDP-glucose 4-epimerase